MKHYQRNSGSDRGIGPRPLATKDPSLDMPGIPDDWREGLRGKEARFVLAYVQHSSGARAAREAGYSGKTTQIYWSIAWELLQKPKIKRSIALLEQAMLEASGLTPERILLEFRKLAFSDMADYVEWGPDGVTIRRSDELDPGASAAVQEVSDHVGKDGRHIRFKPHDKKSALDSLARIAKMFVDRHELSGPDGGPISLDLLVREATIASTNTDDDWSEEE